MCVYCVIDSEHSILYSKQDVVVVKSDSEELI
jgi:hypothetical protein